MNSKENRVTLIIHSRAENVAICRLAAAAFASQLPFTIGELEELKVAVSETITNSVVHGYPEGDGEITMIMQNSHNTAIVTVIDKGVGIKDISQARRPSFTTDPERMGLGFVFIDSFMDKVTVISELKKGTTVIMRKTPEHQANE